LDRTLFAAEVNERLEAADGSIFTLVMIRKTALPEEILGDALLQQVRGDVGDIAGLATDGFGVVLQGARPSQADAFLGRLREALQSEAVVLDSMNIQVFNSATEADVIGELLQANGGESPPPASGS